MLLEPAQQQASQLFLTKEIIELISSSRFNENRSSLSYYICKLLDLMVGQRRCHERQTSLLANRIYSFRP